MNNPTIRCHACGEKNTVSMVARGVKNHTTTMRITPHDGAAVEVKEFGTTLMAWCDALEATGRAIGNPLLCVIDRIELAADKSISVTVLCVDVPKKRKSTENKS